MMTTREALEAALVADPDDAALHAAYADLLIEDGDPRGEYIRLSLLAEDRNQPANQLRDLDTAVSTLRQRHEVEWLGPLARFQQRTNARSVAEPMEPNVSIFWRRGWIDAIRIGQLNQDIINAVAECPFARILGELSIEQNRTDPSQVAAAYRPGEDGLTRDDVDELGTHLDLSPLVGAGRFLALRVFKLGSYLDGVIADGWDAEEYLADEHAPRLEEVRVCSDQFSSAGLFGGEYPRLHTLHLTGNHYRLPFALLGYNDRLPNLRHLFLDTETFRVPADEPGGGRRELSASDFLSLHRAECLPALEYFTLRDSSVGDEGLRLILDAPFFSRLKGLDLSRCGVTDDGAELLANHPHSQRLEHLRLDYNYLSPIGIDALDAIGVTVGEQLFGAPIPRAWEAGDDDGWADEEYEDETEYDTDDIPDRPPDDESSPGGATP